MPDHPIDKMSKSQVRDVVNAVRKRRGYGESKQWAEIQSQATTDAYRKGWERVFGQGKASVRPPPALKRCLVDNDESMRGHEAADILMRKMRGAKADVMALDADLLGYEVDDDAD